MIRNIRIPLLFFIFSLRVNATRLLAHGSDPFGLGVEVIPYNFGGLADKFVVSGVGTDTIFFAITSEGQVYSWARLGGSLVAYSGQGATTPSTIPTLLTGDFVGHRIAEIALGSNFAMARSTNGAIFTWGYNDPPVRPVKNSAEAQISFPYQRPDPIFNQKFAVQIAACSGAAFVRFSDGTVYAWGWNSGVRISALNRLSQYRSFLTTIPIQGLLGVNSTIATGFFEPTPVVITGAAHISCEASVGAIVRNDGTTWVWGNVADAFLADGVDTRNLVKLLPVPVVNLPVDTFALKAWADSKSICILTRNASIYCWGSNMNGYFGTGTIPSGGTRSVPTKMILPVDFIPQDIQGGTRLAFLGAAHRFIVGVHATTGQQQIFGTGSNPDDTTFSGQQSRLPTPTLTRYNPILANPSHSSTQIFGIYQGDDGNGHTVGAWCQIRSDGKLFAYPAVKFQISTAAPTFGDLNRVVQLADPSDFLISIRSAGSVALSNSNELPVDGLCVGVTRKGRAYGWGIGPGGFGGVSATTRWLRYFSPTLISGTMPVGRKVVDMAPYLTESLILDDFGDVYRVGYYNALELSSVATNPTLITIPARPVGSKATHIACGSGLHALALDGHKLYHGGQLLNNVNSQAVNMSLIPPETQWKELVAAGGGYGNYLTRTGDRPPTRALFAIATTGEVWVWGNLTGSLCFPDDFCAPASYCAVPQRLSIPLLGSKRVVTIRVESFGFFIIAENNTILRCQYRSSWSQVPLGEIPVDDQVVSIAPSDWHALLLTTSGHVYGFGRRSRLGFDDLNYAETPVRIPSNGDLYTRKVTHIGASLTSSWQLAPLTIDWSASSGTTREIPQTGKDLRIAAIGLGRNVMETVMVNLSAPLFSCALVSVDEPPQHRVRCRVQTFGGLLPLGPLGVQLIKDGFEISGDFEYNVAVIPDPTVNETSQVTIIENSQIFSLQGVGFGSDIAALAVELLPRGTCNISALENDTITCSRADSSSPLQVGQLLARVSRQGSDYSPAVVIATVEPRPRILLKILALFLIISTFRRRSITSYIWDITGRNFGGNTTTDQLAVQLIFRAANTVERTRTSCSIISHTLDSAIGVSYLRCRSNPIAVMLASGDLAEAIVTRLGGPSEAAAVAQLVDDPVAIQPTTIPKYSSSKKSLVISISDSYSATRADVKVMIMIQSTLQRRSAPFSCNVTSVSSASVECDLEQPLSPGTVMASVSIFGSNMSAFVPVGTAVAPPQVTFSNERLAANAKTLTIRGFGFDINSNLTSVALSPSGSCDIVSISTTSIVCSLSGSSLQIGALQALVSSFGGSSVNLTQVAEIVLAPTVSITPTAVYIYEDPNVVIQGQNFDSSNSQVTLTLNSLYLLPCLPIVSQTNETTIVCAVQGSLNTTGTLTAVVFAYGGESNTAAIGVVQPKPQAPINLDAAAAREDNSRLILALAIGIPVAVIAILIIAAIIVRRRIKAVQNIASKQLIQVTEEQKQLFNIQSSELEIIKKLGEGSFGAVFLALWGKKYVAVKKLTAAVLSNQVSEFFREAALMMSLKEHPNVVRVYGMCQERDNLAMVLEFIPNGSLDSFLNDLRKQGEQVPEYLVNKLAFGIAAGMKSLAEQRICHRDLAARNILLGGDNDPKVADFGFARVVGDDNQGQTSATVGPVRWMSPESIRDRVYSEKSDVWSYASTLYEILTLEMPFGHQNLVDIAVSVRDNGVNPGVPSDASPEIAELMKMCWQVDPEQRPTFTQIVHYLEAHGIKQSSYGSGDDSWTGGKIKEKSKKGKNQSNSPLDDKYVEMQ